MEFILLKLYFSLQQPSTPISCFVFIACILCCCHCAFVLLFLIHLLFLLLLLFYLFLSTPSLCFFFFCFFFSCSSFSFQLYFSFSLIEIYSPVNMHSHLTRPLFNSIQCEY